MFTMIGSIFPLIGLRTSVKNFVMQNSHNAKADPVYFDVAGNLLAGAQNRRMGRHKALINLNTPEHLAMIGKETT